MFSWFRKSPEPPKPLAENPGMGPTVRMAFSNGQRTWQEDDDLVRSLAAVLRELGHETRTHRDWLEVGDDWTLRPQVVQVQPIHPAGAKTVSTVQVAHPRLVPLGIFEYQHSTGDDIRASFAQGFRNWARVDLPVFLEAGAEKPTDTMMLEFKRGTAKVELVLDRRVVLGPTAHFAKTPLAEDTAEEHAFCLCCLFTNSIDAFREQLAKDAFYGIRLFASRDGEGKIQADCRVNGIDWPAGVEALVKYASTWPDRGFEFRKQYVAIQTFE